MQPKGVKDIGESFKCVLVLPLRIEWVKGSGRSRTAGAVGRCTLPDKVCRRAAFHETTSPLLVWKRASM